VKPLHNLSAVMMEQAPMSNKTWELSLYELHRTPQEVITDNTEIAVSPRSLHSELMCPICLDMLKNTMTTKECLHRSVICTCTFVLQHFSSERPMEMSAVTDLTERCPGARFTKYFTIVLRLPYDNVKVNGRLATDV